LRIFVFALLFFAERFSSVSRMPARIDLYKATMAGWAQLDPSERERLFRAGLKAALRLDRLEFRAWLLRRLRNPAARSSDRSGALCNFGSRHGLAAASIGRRAAPPSPAHIDKVHIEGG